MKNTVLILLFCSICISSLAQADISADQKSFVRVKISTELLASFEDIWKIEAAPFIPALQLFTKKGHLHQLELLRLDGNLGERPGPVRIDEGFALAARYEYALPLLSQQAASWMPYIGGGVLHSHSSAVFDTNVNTEFPLRFGEDFTQLYLVPSAVFQIDNKLFLDFALSLALISSQRTRELTGNPGIPVDEQLQFTNQTSFDLFTNMRLRFGISYQL